jgi:predicted ATP-dependent protease
LPSRNEADVDDIPEDVRKELQIVFVSRINEVIDAALEVLVANPPPRVTAGMERLPGQLPTETEPITAQALKS